MNFYSYKLNLYSQNKPDLPMSERMYRAKMFAEEQAQLEYENVKNAYTHSLSINPAPGHGGMVAAGRMAAVTYQDLLLEASNKIVTIQAQTPEEYFEGLAQSEFDSIESYSTEKIGRYAEVTTKLTRLNKNKGITAKFTNFFGQADQAREEFTTEMDLLSQQYSVAQVSLESWTCMPQDEKFEYLVGRIENDNLTSFDKNGLEEYTKALSLIGKENATTQDGFVDTTPSLEE